MPVIFTPSLISHQSVARRMTYSSNVCPRKTYQSLHIVLIRSTSFVGRMTISTPERHTSPFSPSSIGRQSVAGRMTSPFCCRQCPSPWSTCDRTAGSQAGPRSSVRQRFRWPVTGFVQTEPTRGRTGRMLQHRTSGVDVSIVGTMPGRQEDNLRS